MLLPNKFASLKESALAEAAFLLERLKEPVPLTVLYSSTRSRFAGIADFVYTIDLLHILNKVAIDTTSGVIHRVG